MADTTPQRILGIDPGTRVVGWGIVEKAGQRLHPLVFGTIRPPTDGPYEHRLRVIFEGVAEQLEAHTPDAMAIESVYFGKNVKSAMKIGEGRAVCLLAAALVGLPVHPYTAPEIKKAVTGNGRARKEQVQEMVRLLLHLKEAPRPDDITDALAAAICHCHRDGLQSRLRSGSSW